MNNNPKVGVYVCHCGVNISQTVRVDEITEVLKSSSNVVVSKSYKFMCSDPGQKMIEDDIKTMG